MNLVSGCCNASITQGTERDPYPLGRGEYNGSGISYKVDVCESCGREAESVEACGDCGELLEYGRCQVCEVVTV